MTDPSTASAIISPKLTLRDAVFPFYAGFSKAFVADVLRRHGDCRVVLDPWNGSGTTTSVASRCGMASIGVDINPAMLVVAKGSLAQPRDVALAREFLEASLRGAATADIVVGDPLLQWFTLNTARRLRNVSAGILGRRSGSAASLQNLSIPRSFAMLALFRACKNLARTFGTKNPTWTRRLGPGDTPLQITNRDLASEIWRAIALLSSRLDQRTPGRLTPKLLLADARALPLGNETIDLVVTSPPYCTRIDYTVAVGLELALTAPLTDGQIRTIRTSTIGTTAVESQTLEPTSAWGSTCTGLLANVKDHPSKASATYYYKTHVAYFAGLYRAFMELSRVLVPRGRAVVVVQDSFYKELHTDLPRIAMEIGWNCGLRTTERADFPVRTSMVSLNRNSRTYRQSHRSTESVLTFVKDP